MKYTIFTLLLLWAATIMWSAAIIFRAIPSLHRTVQRLRTWFTWKTVCAWCVPPRRTRGNPWATNTTHGMCKRCFKRVLREHAERDRQQRRVARAILAESLFRQRVRTFKATLKPTPPVAPFKTHQHTLETRSRTADVIKLKLGQIPALSVPSAQSINPQRSTIN